MQKNDYVQLNGNRAYDCLILLALFSDATMKELALIPKTFHRYVNRTNIACDERKMGMNCIKLKTE